MTKLAKEISLIEKKIKLIQENYAILTLIQQDSIEYKYLGNGPLQIPLLLERYKLKLREKNLERSRETKQIDIEDSINEIKNEQESTEQQHKNSSD